MYETSCTVTSAFRMTSIYLATCRLLTLSVRYVDVNKAFKLDNAAASAFRHCATRLCYTRRFMML